MSDTESVLVAPITVNEKKWWVALVVCGAISVISFIWLIYSLSRITDYLGDVSRLEVSATNIVRDVNDATFSKDYELSSQAYTRLANDVQSYETTLAHLQKNSLIGHRSLFNELSENWQAKKQSATYVIEHQNDINALQDLQKQVKDATTQMQSLYMQLSEQAITSGMPANTVRDIQLQIIALERIGESVTGLVSTVSTSPETFKQLVSDFGTRLANQQTSYPQAAQELQNIHAIHERMILPVVSSINNLSSPAIQARQSAQDLNDLAATTQEKLLSIERGIVSQKTISVPAILAILTLLLAMYALVQLFKNRSRTERIVLEKEAMRQRQAMETEAELARLESDRVQRMEIQQKNSQAAILRLLDELGDLAEGDLTVSATVTEEFTGAIADSVNFAIDQLRKLVLAINDTSDRIAQSSQQTQMTAVELADASEQQAQEIAGVSAAISQMAVSIDQVSSNALESANVAQRSVAIAHNGAEAVHRSIEGMNIIRDQIQETSKRIKRLGESSQEIGNIVNLINDIAEQTNILALNAAIQASMAGEAGRGFAVVADEVQRLAERSAAATRQIELLVKTIQADTNEAVSSMESTTSEVVKGAKLAKDAGEALDEVQNVSHTLADLIENISNAARQQATSASHISNTMGVIQDITSQTSSGTMATARSVGRLNEMAAELQKSVSGFKLSNDEEIATLTL